MQDFGNPIPIEIIPEYNSVSVNALKVKVDVIFRPKKALSFTTKIEFEGDNERYAIYISGTAENSIQTNYPFFQTFGEDYRQVGEYKQPVTLVEAEYETKEIESVLTPQRQESMNISRGAGSITSKSTKNLFGFTTIPLDKLERSCDHAKRWLNEYIVGADVISFPNDIIAADGAQIYDLIEFLCKRAPPFVRLDSNLKKNEKVDFLLLNFRFLN